MSQRTLVLVQQSLPDCCAVCEGDRRMRLVSVFGIPAIGATPCLHCDPIAAGRDEAVEVQPLPMLDDTRRSTA